MNAYQVERRERQRKVLERRVAVERRAGWAEAMRIDKAQRERRAGERRAINAARLADWQARYDSALAARESGK